MGKGMVKGHKLKLMEISMKGKGRIGKNMDKEHLLFLGETSM